MQLEIEREALRRETDDASRERLQKLENELADLRAEQERLRAQWEKEKSSIDAVRQVKEKIEQTRHNIEEAERDYDLNRAAELKYSTLFELEKQLRELKPGRMEQSRRCSSRKSGRTTWRISWPAGQGDTCHAAVGVRTGKTAFSAAEAA